jgi:hypothetical protein
LRAEVETRRKAEEEARLQAEAALRRIEEEAHQRAEAALLKAEEEARLRNEEELRRKSEEEARLQAEAALRRTEEEAHRRAEDALRKAHEEARLRAEEEIRRKSEAEARLRAEEALKRAEEEARLRAEEDSQHRAAEEARIRAEEEARVRAELEASIRAELEEQLRVRETARRHVDEPTSRVPEAELFTPAEPITLAPATTETQPSVAATVIESEHQVADPWSLAPEPAAVVPNTDTEAAPESVTEIMEWVDVGLDTNHRQPQSLDSAFPLNLPEQGKSQEGDDRYRELTYEEIGGGAFHPVSVPETHSSLEEMSPHLLERLSATDPAERTAALTSLSEVKSRESLYHIKVAFDDQSAEVRNAAARALFDYQTDRAAAFTQALREGSPERRRRIGAAIASSGLANEAIRNLTGESREKTYDAFSLLFLMSKAGEVQPLMRAIEEHPNIEVRLAVVKLLALSGQPSILPSFRRMAVRGSLPPEVRSAVMEAIYQMTSQSPADAPSLV